MNWIEELEKEMILQMRKADVYFISPGGYTVSHTYKVYNPETHELVEKKDAKIKRIKASIEASERQKQNNEALTQQCYKKLVEYKENISTCEQDIEKLEQELKELEN